MAEPLGTEFLELSLQVAAGAFEQGTVALVLTPLERLQHVLQGQAKLLFFAQPVGRFPCQARSFDGSPGGSLVLLRFHRLAFPASGHKGDYSFS